MKCLKTTVLAAKAGNKPGWKERGADRQSQIWYFWRWQGSGPGGLGEIFKPGDFRAGYYRDQTFMFATGIANVEQYFAQLFSDPDINNDPFSAGRQMNAQFRHKKCS